MKIKLLKTIFILALITLSLPVCAIELSQCTVYPELSNSFVRTEYYAKNKNWKEAAVELDSVLTLKDPKFQQIINNLENI